MEGIIITVDAVDDEGRDSARDARLKAADSACCSACFSRRADMFDITN